MSESKMKQKAPETNQEDRKADLREESAAVPETGEGPPPEEAPAEDSFSQNSSDPMAELEAVREESRQHFERCLRVTADFENYRRRMVREKEELRQFALASFVEDFLPVLDNLDLGLQTAEKHPEAAAVTAGFKMVADQIQGILKGRGVVVVDPSGEKFDPHLHESVASQNDPEIPEGHVSHVIRKGYSLNGRLIRPASVVVSAGKAAEPNS